jgi:hypothetical protein
VNDIKVRLQELSVYSWFQKMDEVRQAVIIGVAFAGIGTLLHFHKMLTACDNEDWVTASKELQDSQWFHDVKDRGPRLVKQLLTGEWQ